MKKAKKRTSTTIGFMLIITIAILLVYYYTSNSSKPLINTNKELTEAEKILAEDYENNYPATPKETIKVFARIMRALYNNPKDDEVEPLALKIRGFYDKELLANNPEDTYLLNLKTELAEWKQEKRTITNYLIVKEDQVEEKTIDGVNYAIYYVQYTIQENGKFTELWKVLLRQDSEKRWKVLGWEVVPQEDSEK